jgi:branched-chain amino acid transport system substrate-binding protein
MLRKFAVLVIALAFVVLSLGGCASQTATTAPATEAPAVAAPATEVAPTEAPTQGPPILIGLEGPMTGDYALEGQGFKNAVQLLVDQTNAAGGILGRQVELIVVDDAGDPTQAALVAQQLVDQKVVAVIGAYNSSATEPASGIYNEAGILQVTPSSTRVSLSDKGYPLFFRTCFLDDRQGLFAANFFSQVLGAKNVGILHDNSTYGQGLAEETKKYSEEAGLTVGFFDAINPSDTDFTPILTTIKAANLDVVYFTGYFSQFGLLLKQSKALGLTNKWVGGDANNNVEVVTIGGLDAVTGAYVTSTPSAKDLDYPEPKQFIADYNAKYGEDLPSVWTLMAAEGYNVIRYAMEQSQSTDPVVLGDYLHNKFTEFSGLSGPVLGFDEKGDRKGALEVAYVIDSTGAFILNDQQPTVK